MSSASSVRGVHSWLLGALLISGLLSGCGVFGDGDSQASAAESAVVESRTVRVATGDRFFDIDPTSLVDASGNPTSTATDTLTSRVSGLSAGTADPTNAGVIFDGDAFVMNPSIPGSTPDIETLLRLLTAAISNDDVDALDVPFTPIRAEVSNDDASAYAAELNERIAGGLNVSAGGEEGVLSASVLGEATTVEWLDGQWVVSVDYDGLANELDAIFGDVGTDGGEATFRVEPGEGDEPGTVVIVPGTPGTRCCNNEASANRIARALTSNVATTTLTLDSVDGERGVEWAESLGIEELVGSFTTRYTAGQDRNINIERIAEITRGHIIEPGETWSLNERVGQRTRANGFVPAGTIINGHLTDSVGGGISQYATTIFNAAFFAGLEFDQYQAHTIYFSRYPYGREATISWPAPQLEIHNPTPYGILIWPTTTSNSITVELYSTKWADAEQTGQFENTVQVACTRVTTERTRTFVDGTTDVDSVFAIYRQEGIGCDGEPTDDPDAPPPTTTVPVDDEDNGEDDEGNGEDEEGNADGEGVPEGEAAPTAPETTDPGNENPEPVNEPEDDGAGDGAPDPPAQPADQPPTQDAPPADAPPADASDPDPDPDTSDPDTSDPGADSPPAEDLAAPAQQDTA